MSIKIVPAYDKKLGFYEIERYNDNPIDTSIYMNHFDDIKKYASIIENRLDDEYCTFQSVLQDNRKTLELAQNYNVNYILIDDSYQLNIEL